MHKSVRKLHFLMGLIVLSVMLCASFGVARGQNVVTQEMRGGWQPGPDIYHPSRVIVRFSDAITTNAATDSIQRLGYSVYGVADFKPTAASPSGARFGIVELPEEVSPDAAILRLSDAPGILYAERDYIRYKDQVHEDAPIIPNDPEFAKLWGLHNENCRFKDPAMDGNPVDDADTDAPEAWSIATGSNDVIVAVIDTGIYVDHPDLDANIWRNPDEIPGNGIDDDGNGYIDDVYGWDFVNNDNTVFDANERDRYGYLNDQHGTHCAGTIAGVGNNGIGVSGVNWNAKVMSLKFIGPNGGYTSDAILAMQYAHNKGAKVISCSWGGGGFDQALKDAIEATQAIVCCAAGNSGDNNDVTPHYPSSYDCENIISVAASMQNEQPCRYSGWWSTCYGATTVDLFAPGGYILSTLPPDPVPSTPAENYGFFYGTSMATPHVSGAAALLRSLFPDTPPATIKGMILDNVDVFPQYEGLALTGGRLNIANAIMGGVSPIITSINAVPKWGPPPLEVSFAATSMTPQGVIVDKWWDFGDGSDAVHEWEPTHIYEAEGMYDASFHVLNNGGFEAHASVQIHVFHPPVIGVEPSEIHTRLQWGETCEKAVTITNSGEGDLDYTVEVQFIGMVDASGAAAPIRGLRSGGPDQCGYFWADSDEPGIAAPEWFDISKVGTRVGVGGTTCVTVDLPFEFPFYGQTKTSILIGSKGYLTFSGWGYQSENKPIPRPYFSPTDLMAVFWDDLNPGRKGVTYYYGDEEKFVVQYEDWIGVSGEGEPCTFQATLTPAGSITYHYKEMRGVLDSATVGIENADGTVGLQVAYNQDYVHDGLGVFFSPVWLSLDESTGSIAPGGSDALTAAFAAHNLPQGTWKASIRILSNDPVNPQVDIGTFMFAKSLIPPTIGSISAEPWAGSAPLSVQFSAAVHDSDGRIAGFSWDFGDGSDPIQGTLTPIHTYTADGEYTATLSVTDDDGLCTQDSVTVVVGHLPEIEVHPVSLDWAIRAHRTDAKTLTVTNTGDRQLAFTATAVYGHVEPAADGIGTLAEGGSDRFGYIWTDSDEPGGPEFDWFEISGIGTPMLEWHPGATLIDLPFDFPFYGDVKSKVHLSPYGSLRFGQSWNLSLISSPIPNAAGPNDWIAVYGERFNWGHTYTNQGLFHYYDEANDRFIVQWHNFSRYREYSSPYRYTFQAILYPDGTIVYQYLNMNFSPDGASSGIIGIENADGTDGLQILYNTAGYMHNNLAIEIVPVAWLSAQPEQGVLEPGESTNLEVTVDLARIRSGPLEGAIAIDSNDIRAPRKIVPVDVQVIPNSPPVITACDVSPRRGPSSATFEFVAAAHDSDGAVASTLWDFGDGSPLAQGFAAHHHYTRPGKYTATFIAADNDGYVARATVEVEVVDPPSASWDPSQYQFVLPRGQGVSDTLILSNAGPGILTFGLADLSSTSENGREHVRPEGIQDPHARTAEGIRSGSPNPKRSKWLPDEIGSVITSWRCPAPIGRCWGVGLLPEINRLVVGDLCALDYVVTPWGTQSGKSWRPELGGGWGADIASDGKYVWQVDVGGDNAIHKIDPATGTTVGSISGSEWTKTSQRGLAYNPNDDTFYIAGWNEEIIYKIKGETWGAPGEVVEQWPMSQHISGLAYHPVADILAVTTNDEDLDMVFFVHAASHAPVAAFPHPFRCMHSGAGCEFGLDGNLWVASQMDNTMYLVETGLGPTGTGAWLSWVPDEGTVPANGSVSITITVDTLKLDPGIHRGKVVLVTNDPEYPLIMVPVTAHVAAEPLITECTATPTVGEPPLDVAFYAEFVAPEMPVVSYGWDFGDGTSSTELGVTHTYTEVGNYTAVFSVVDQLGGTAKESFDISVEWLPRPTVDPALIEVTLPAKGSSSHTVTVGNVEGNASLAYSVKVKDGAAPMATALARTEVIADPCAMTTEGLYLPLDPDITERIAAPVEPGGVGSIIKSWPAPEPVGRVWGVGYDSTDVWLSDPGKLADHLVTPEGIYTGVSFVTAWAEFWPADMAYDRNRNLMWQVSVADCASIHGMDITTGAEVMKINRGGTWIFNSQRGLAYDPETDTFYIGGWLEDAIYHIMGPSWPTPGAVLGRWRFQVGIAGLAWHPDGMLWVSSNNAPDMIYGVDLDACAVVYEFPHPYGGSYGGAGIALHEDGTLWVASQDNNYVYLINTEMPITPAIGVEPEEGTIARGESAGLEVTINAVKLGRPGQDIRKHLDITTDDPMNPVLRVDLIVHIESGPTIVGATATPAIGEPPLQVAFDATIEPGATDIVDIWWDFGDGSDPAHEACVEHVYSELGVYEASVHAVDRNEVEASARVPVTVKWLPVLQIEPEKLDEIVPVGGEAQTVLKIKNTGVGPMSFQIAVAKGSGDGADQSPLSGPVLKANPTSGYLVSGGTQDVVLTLGSVDAARGIYSFRLELSTDDPYRPLVVVPVKLKINASPSGELTAPVGGETWTGKQEIKWTATDPDDPADALTVDLHWSRDGGEWHEIAKGLANTGSHMWSTASVGLGGDAFRVRMVATDPAGQASETISESFTILNDAPTAAFSYSPLPVTVTSVVEFVDESTDDGEIVAWHWEFGDGAESSEQNPKHQYSAKRKFTVKLTVTDDGGLAGVCEKQIRVVNIAPTVKIVKPEAGETWTRAREIEYEASDADGDPLTIRLEYDYLGDEAGWQLIADGRENAGKYLWDISKLAKGGRYRVRVAAADPDGGTAEAVSGEFTIIVLKHMAMAAPNPAKGSVTFYYDIESDAVIYVYDVAGRLVYSADLAAGTNAHEWSLTTSGRPVAAGLYLYVVVTCDGVKSEVGRLVIER